MAPQPQTTPSRRKPRLEKITVSLLKEGHGRDEALDDAASLRSYRILAIDSREDSLFVASKAPKPPPWSAYLRPHVEEPLDGLLTASASAVLVLATAGRTFAITFGHGRHLLEREALEHDFGLRVVLNTVAPDQLKSVDTKTIDDRTMQARRDLSRDSSLSAFGLDVSRDVLRAVTGTPRDPTLAHRLTGSDSLGIHTRLQVPELPGLAERLLTEYRSDAYKENFDFIDHLRPERSNAQISRLHDRLVHDLNNWEITNVHLAPPETLDWLDARGFRFSTQGPDVEPASDPSISSYLESRRDRDITLELLKRDRLRAIRASDDNPMGNWQVHECLVYQVELDGYLYVLSAGQWFRVDRNYRNDVETEVNAIPIRDGLPRADPGTSEAAYNTKAAEDLGGLCLDRKCVQDPGPDSIELCDVLTPDGGFIHVKHRGSSSTLSHLFAQGVNSAERLREDDTFREAARALIASEDAQFSDVIPPHRPRPEDHEITFVVLTRSTRGTPLTLPFFSVISLRNAARRLERGLGFRVSRAAVLEEEGQ